MGHIPLLN